MAKTRTFIAVEIAPNVRALALDLAKQLQPLTSDMRWVAEENLHYTLQFLGDITDQEIADVCSRVGKVASNWEPFSLAVCGAGAFPSVDRPRTLWIGAGRGAEELKALQSDIDSAMADLGFRGENRRYVPHLTIGRAGRSPGATSAELPTKLADLANFEAGISPITDITVFASQLRREGPEYHVLARCPLGRT